MKLLSGNDDRSVVREQPIRSQDDATVGYIFQRPHPHEAEFAAQYAQKQHPRWASGEDHSLDNQDKWKFNPPNPMNSNAAPGGGMGPVGPMGMGMGTGGLGNMGTNGGMPQLPPIGNGGMSGNPMQNPNAKHPQMMNHQHQHQHPHPQHPSHQQMANHMGAPNHLNSTVLNHALSNPNGPLQMQMQPIQGNVYDHMHPSLNMNGVPKPPQQGGEQLVYLGGPQGHLGMMAAQNQYMNAANRNAAAITTSTAKKLWEKSDVKGPNGGSGSGGPLNPLHIPGVADHPVWKDSTWSTQGENILAPPRPRTFPQPPDSNQAGSAGILSPRDSTSGLGVKMVEYVLGGSPTNKESPLSSLEPRLRGLKFDDNEKSHDDKENANSPFDSNGLKKDDQVTATNGVVVNGIDDDKGFNRTPGSRQPSPAEESLPRPPTLLDPSTHVGSGFPPHNFHHMLGAMDHQGGPGPQMNSYPHPQMQQMNQMQQPVMNGVGGMHQVQQNQMMNQNSGPNQLESPANMLQQQQNYDVQQLFRSQNHNLAVSNAAAAAAAGAQGAPNGTMASQQQMAMASQQYLAAQQNAYAQQGTPYVIPGQEAAPYMGLIAAQMPQYYGVAPWGVYPGNLIPQQGSQPRRPLTPSQQGAENQPFQVIPAFFDQSGSLVMGPRTGTPMRLVSPAPVLVPPGAARAGGPPPQGPPQLYPGQPQTAQQNLYSTQNGSSVGGGGLFAPQAFSGGLGTLGSPAQPTGLALNTSSLTARRDSFDRNTSAFSPSMDYSTTVAATANAVSSSAAAAAAAAVARKWPVGNYGTLGTVGNASASPIGAPITPPPPSGLMTNRAPGAETKYRNVNPLATVGLSAANAMFGSNSSLFSKHLTIPGAAVAATTAAVRQQSAVAAAAVAGAAAAAAAAGANGDRAAPGRSRLLEEFRNQRHPNLQLRDLTNHIVEFSQDQHGSRFIQQKLERATAVEKQMVFNEILGAAYSLMTDVFGNYVIQKFFEFGTPEQKGTLAMQVKGHVLPLALQMYGCRVIQKALESISADQQQEIVRELDGHVLKCVKDQNGNHVVQKCIECVEPNALQFIINAFKSQVYTLSTHPYGCRVIQRILEHCTIEQTQPILDELHENTEQLIQDQYGNYVIQHVLEHGKPEDKSILIQSVRGKVLVLSQHKFASNVVEKCVTHATRSERTGLIDEVCTFNDSALHVMMKDQYANYVVQKMIDVSEPTQLKKLMNKIRPHMTALRKYTYGKHINAKLEKFFMKSSNPVPPATMATGTIAANTVATAVTNNGTENGVTSTTASPTAAVAAVSTTCTTQIAAPTSGVNANGGLGPIGPPTNGVM